MLRLVLLTLSEEVGPETIRASRRPIQSHCAELLADEMQIPELHDAIRGDGDKNAAISLCTAYDDAPW